MRLVIGVSVLVVMAGLVAVGPAAGQAYWVPKAGFDQVYSASSGLLPDQQGWQNGGYADNAARIVNGASTDDFVLWLDHTAADGATQFAAWDRLDSHGTGTSEDYFTLDLRFRLVEPVSTDQFTLAVVRPANDIMTAMGYDEQRYVFRFNTNGVNVSRGTGFINHTAPLGRSWHDARLLIDNSHQTAQLYLNGSIEPLLSTTAAGGNLGRNFIRFGDGSSTVSGAVEISHVKWSNRLMAVPLTGGQIEIHNRTLVVENAEEHLNFPFAQRFNDGTVWMSHSVGTHTVTERGARLWSLDNGNTWAEPTIDSISAINTHQFDDGRIISLGAWNRAYTTKHDILVRRWSSPTSNKTQSSVTIELPWTAQLFLHRTMIRAGDGSLVQTAYTRMEDQQRFRAFTLRSTDDGETWSYGGTIGFDPNAPFDTGFSEPTIVRLADDTLLSLMRSGSPGDVGSLMQSKSTDHGATWSTPQQIADFGVDPHVIRVASGALVASSGRPGVYLLVDLTGTGDHWEQIEIYDGPGSSYTSLIEVEPNLVMLLHDESGFNHTNVPEGVPNRLYSTYVRIVPEPGTASVVLTAGLFLLKRKCTEQPHMDY